MSDDANARKSDPKFKHMAENVENYAMMLDGSFDALEKAFPPPEGFVYATRRDGKLDLFSVNGPDLYDSSAIRALEARVAELEKECADWKTYVEIVREKLMHKIEETRRFECDDELQWTVMIHRSRAFQEALDVVTETVVPEMPKTPETK